MEGILIIVVLVVVALLFLKAKANLPTDSADAKTALGYRKKKTLFTQAERSFLGVLDSCLDPAKFRIFGKVRVADLLEPNPSKNRSEWLKAFNAINAKHVDYVICKADTLKPLCAIELDDKSHQQKKRQQRDALLESAFKEASLPLIRIPAQRTYKPEAIKAALVSALSSQKKPLSKPLTDKKVTTKQPKQTAQIKSAPEHASVSKETVEKGVGKKKVPVGEVGG